VVQQLSALFDGYWNSEQVWPIASLVSPPWQADAARRRFDELVAAAPAALRERPRDALGARPVGEQLDGGRIELIYGSARAFADTPAKAAGLKEAEKDRTVTEQTLALFAQAHEQVSIASPYFIPGERGLEMMRAVGATQDNGRITLLTNSLGATDEPLVHAAYSRYRLEMLKAGVRIWEISPTLTQRSGRLGSFGRSLGRLHAKAATIDRHLVYIGSMNLDARSARVNTEVGIAIESAELAATIGKLAREDLVTGAYRLRLSADGEHVEWVETGSDGRVTVHTEEPDSHWWLSLKLWLRAPFVSDDLL